LKRAFAALALIGCGHTQAQPPNAPQQAPVDTAAFERGEDEILRDLASIDRRFARRARIEPSEEDLQRVAMAALTNGDETLAMNDGAIDPFSFDARARGLAAVKKKLGALPNAGIERDLLGRVVDGEEARLDEERALPRSASALIRAIVDTWSAPKDEREAAEDDRWLSRRVREVRESMEHGEVDVVRARDLDDALDALERLASAPGFVKTTQELVKMREALEAAGSKPAAKAHSDWDVVEKRLRAQVGAVPDDFDALEKDLRSRADAAVTAASIDRRSLNSEIDKVLFQNGPCVDAVPGSRVRSLTAPHEREASCHLRKAVAAATDARGQALMLAVLHDHVVVAQWALDVARGAGNIAQAEGRHHMLVPLVQPLSFARLERIALARPASAIGTGEAVRLLAAGDPLTRATAWAKLGDVPFDIAARELGR
jgi:hypothetical protein